MFIDCSILVPFVTILCPIPTEPDLTPLIALFIIAESRTDTFLLLKLMKFCYDDFDLGEDIALWLSIFITTLLDLGMTVLDPSISFLIGGFCISPIFITILPLFTLALFNVLNLEEPAFNPGIALEALLLLIFIKPLLWFVEVKAALVRDGVLETAVVNRNCSWLFLRSYIVT